jgi:hypothetical protein
VPNPNAATSANWPGVFELYVTLLGYQEIWNRVQTGYGPKLRTVVAQNARW